MRKIIIILVITLMLLMSFLPLLSTVLAESSDLELDSQSVVLIDSTSGSILYQKNATEKLYPASITKIMTVYLALELKNPEETVTASKTAIDTIDRSSSHIWLDYNEESTILDMCYATLLMSANDAANVLAEAVGGSQEAFVEMMNQAAIEMGAMNTHFSNAHGLHNEDHYTTAQDMAIITRYALQNEMFKEIFETIRYVMEPTNKQKDSRPFANGNEMLKAGANYYEFAVGGKIGWTPEAGYTSITTAKQNDLELIAVVMKSTSKDKRYQDTKKMFEYGFSNYKTMVIKASDQLPYEYQFMKGKKVQANIKFTLEDDFRILLRKDYIEELVTVKYEVRNTDSLDTVEGYAILMMNKEPIAETKMTKEVTKYDLSFQAIVWPKIQMGIDVVSATVTVGFFMLFIVALIGFRNRSK